MRAPEVRQTSRTWSRARSRAERKHHQVQCACCSDIRAPRSESRGFAKARDGLGELRLARLSLLFQFPSRRDCKHRLISRVSLCIPAPPWLPTPRRSSVEHWKSTATMRSRSGKEGRTMCPRRAVGYWPRRAPHRGVDYTRPGEAEGGLQASFWSSSPVLPDSAGNARKWRSHEFGRLCCSRSWLDRRRVARA
jgi:hypothetical protein